jgi:hypothetical protein
MDQLTVTASVGAVVGTSVLLYFMTAPRRRHRDDSIHLTPWEEHSSIARSRKFRDQFQKRRGGNKIIHNQSCSRSTRDYSHPTSSYLRKISTISTSEDDECANSMNGSCSVTSDQSWPTRLWWNANTTCEAVVTRFYIGFVTPHPKELILYAITVATIPVYLIQRLVLVHAVFRIKKLNSFNFIFTTGSLLR